MGRSPPGTVFIGQNLKHEYIQLLLDDCLMTDDEFEMGLDAWKAIYGDVFLDGGDAEHIAKKNKIFISCTYIHRIRINFRCS